jgi:uncharacterized protein YecT (DUF1311 family)
MTMSEVYGYVWTSIKDGMEIRFTRMYPNEFYKPTDITPVYKETQRAWIDLTDDEMLMIYGQQHEGKKYSLGRMVQAALKEKNT